MRRTDREITDGNKINKIIQSCHCCRLGLNDNGKVYIVPLNYGYSIEDNRRIFYFHGAKEGRKIDLITKNHYAGFELDTSYELVEGKSACEHTARYQSVIGCGIVTLIEEREEKKKALQAIMYQNTGNANWEFSDKMLEAVGTFKLEVEEISCKEHK